MAVRTALAIDRLTPLARRLIGSRTGTAGKHYREPDEQPASREPTIMRRGVRGWKEGGAKGCQHAKGTPNGSSQILAHALAAKPNVGWGDIGKGVFVELPDRPASEHNRTASREATRPLKAMTIVNRREGS